MSAPRANPTVRRWELAAALRALRLEAGLSIEDVAAELMCSPAKVSRLETAGRGIQPRDVRDLCRLYKVGAPERDRLMALAAEAKRPAWWQGLRSLPPETTAFFDLEAAASEVHASEGQRIAGLLQTEEYTRSLLSNLQPPEYSYDIAFVEQTVAARKRRQEAARIAGTKFKFIVDEGALRRPFGSLQDMQEQIDLLLDASFLPNHEIFVLPFGKGLHAGIHGTFVHLNFPQGTLPDAVLVEGQLGVFVIDKEAETARYGQIFDHLLTIALDIEGSREWLSQFRAKAMYEPDS